jgi:uncharacterized peroxidase-related enzyme
MRLREVERGDGFFRRCLIRFISWVSGMRLPDAVRVVWYRKAFFGDPMSAWTHAAMRGESAWTVGERELMAALVARWNSCVFCTKAHGAVASRALKRRVVNAALEDFRRAALPDGLRATLVFLEKLTLRPEDLIAEDARAVLRTGVSPQALEDAIAVATLFNIIARYADAFDFAIPGDVDLERAADRLLTRGYAA